MTTAPTPAYAELLSAARGFLSTDSLSFDDIKRTIDRLRTAVNIVTVTGTDHHAVNLVAHLHRQRAFSARTFGPGPRLAGVLDHIRKELREVEANPTDISEWIDLVLLALDGAWRQGFTPEQIAEALTAKQAKNEARTWPDWRTMPDGKAIEHDRTVAT